MKEEQIKKILIIRLSAWGDTIHTLPAVYALRKKFPKAQIDWVIEDKASKFIENNPLINNVYVIKRNERSFKSFFSLILKLRKQHYDIALDFQQLLKSGIILGFCAAKQRITLDGGREFSWIFANKIVKAGRKSFDVNYHVVKRNIDLVKSLGCDSEEIKFVLPDFENEYSKEIKEIFQNLDKSKKTLVLSPATTWGNKHWSVKGWQDIIKEFKNQCNIVVTASNNEKELISEMIKDTKNGGIIDLTGKTKQSDLVYIFKNADIVVSPDSGSAHAAWVAGAKSIITLFFATSANRTAPFGENYYAIQAKSECSPCMKKKCLSRTDKNKCIGEITSEEVINIIKKVFYYLFY